MERATWHDFSVIISDEVPDGEIRIVPAATTTAPPHREGAVSRADVLRAIERLRAAQGLLEAHARACTDPDAPAHATALRRAGGMVRRLVEL